MNYNIWQLEDSSPTWSQDRGWHSGYIGGLREVRAETMLKTHPERVIEWAVQGMLPKNRLGRAMAKKMKVYRGATHPHQAQRPETLAAKVEVR